MIDEVSKYTMNKVRNIQTRIRAQIRVDISKPTIYLITAKQTSARASAKIFNTVTFFARRAGFRVRPQSSLGTGNKPHISLGFRVAV